jgi:hypothetical protein
MAADHFTIVANSVARDRKLSYAAKGLFLNMASHREGFTITEEFLARQSTDGVKSVRRLLIELRAAGYIYRSPERTRYPAGTRNAAGKDISGALGPYTWFVTDKPDEIAVILAQYAAETAGQDKLPVGEVVPTVRTATDSADGGLPAGSAASVDQGEQGVSARGDLRPRTTGVTGSSKEDHPEKTNEKIIGGAVARPSTPATRNTLPDSRSGSGETEFDVSLATHACAKARANDDQGASGDRWWGPGARATRGISEANQ